VCTQTKSCKYVLIFIYQLFYVHNSIHSALIKQAVLQDYRTVFTCTHKKHDEKQNVKIKKKNCILSPIEESIVDFLSYGKYMAEPFIKSFILLPPSIIMLLCDHN